MITAIVNGEKTQYDDKKYHSFKEFYDDNKVDGKVLTELIVNDKEVPVSKLDEIFTATFEGGETIEMAFEELIPFTLNLLSNLMEYFGRFEDALPDFARNIRSGDAESIDGLKNLQEGLKALEVMKTNLFALTGTHEGDFLELDGEKEKLQQNGQAQSMKQGKNPLHASPEWLAWVEIKANFPDIVEGWPDPKDALECIQAANQANQLIDEQNA